MFFRKRKLHSFFGFSLFSTDFGGARGFLMSKSDSSRYFASDGQIFRSVGRLEWSEGRKNGSKKRAVLINLATAPRPQATGKTHPCMSGQPLPAGGFRGARVPRQPELDLKKYDLKRPDFEGIWLPIQG